MDLVSLTVTRNLKGCMC